MKVTWSPILGADFDEVILIHCGAAGGGGDELVVVTVVVVGSGVGIEETLVTPQDNPGS